MTKKSNRGLKTEDEIHIDCHYTEEELEEMRKELENSPNEFLLPDDVNRKFLIDNMRPTPTLEGEDAERFYNEINDGEMSEKQKKFLEECSALVTQIGGGHYKDFEIQPVEYITKNNIPYTDGNVIKYISRHRFKNGIEDLRKAQHYLQLIAEMEYGEKL